MKRQITESSLSSWSLWCTRGLDITKPFLTAVKLQQRPVFTLKLSSRHVSLIFILSSSDSGNVFFPSPFCSSWLASKTPIISLISCLVLTFKAGIGNALADSRQGGRHLNDLISSHIGLVWLRRGEETSEEASFRAPRRPLESQSESLGGYSGLSNHCLRFLREMRRVRRGKYSLSSVITPSGKYLL